MMHRFSCTSTSSSVPERAQIRGQRWHRQQGQQSFHGWPLQPLQTLRRDRSTRASRPSLPLSVALAPWTFYGSLLSDAFDCAAPLQGQLIKNLIQREAYVGEKFGGAICSKDKLCLKLPKVPSGTLAQRRPRGFLYCSIRADVRQTDAGWTPDGDCCLCGEREGPSAALSSTSLIIFASLHFPLSQVPAVGD